MVTKQFKELLVDAEQQLSRLQGEAALRDFELCANQARIKQLELALDARTSALAVANGQCAASQERHDRHLDAWRQHSEKRLASAERRVQALADQLEKANGQLIQSEAIGQAAHAKLDVEIQRAEAAARQVIGL